MFNNKKGIFVNKYLLIILVILLVGGIIGSIHYYGKYKALTVNKDIDAQKKSPITSYPP